MKRSQQLREAQERVSSLLASLIDLRMYDESIIAANLGKRLQDEENEAIAKEMESEEFTGNNTGSAI